MAVQDRGVALFDARMKKTNKVSEGFYKATSSKRKSELIPKGVRIYDLDEAIIYYGDGSTYGGVAIGGDNAMRKITVESGAATTVQVTSTDTGSQVSFTDSKFVELNTGDGVTLSAGAGTLPSGLGAAEHWVIKTPGQNDPTFIFASSRVNALAGTGETVFNSGAVGWLSNATTICSNGGENMLYIAADTDVTCCVPYEGQSEDYGVTIAKSGGAGVVTVSGLTSAGVVAGLDVNGSGDTSIALRTNVPDYVELTLDTDGDEYIMTNSRIA